MSCAGLSGASCQSVRSGVDHEVVLFLARLLCSDPDCAERIEEHVADLAELDRLACECGCTYELIAVSAATPGTEPVRAARLEACPPLAVV